MLKHITFVACLCLPLSALGKTCWEYRIVDTAAEPEATKLSKKASNRGGAAPGLVNVLNQLGAEGWELIGSTEVQVFENAPFDQQGSSQNNTWTARLVPEVTLFRREGACK